MEKNEKKFDRKTDAISQIQIIFKESILSFPDIKYDFPQLKKLLKYLMDSSKLGMSFTVTFEISSSALKTTFKIGASALKLNVWNIIPSITHTKNNGNILPYGAPNFNVRKYVFKT